MSSTQQDCYLPSLSRYKFTPGLRGASLRAHTGFVLITLGSWVYHWAVRALQELPYWGQSDTNLHCTGKVRVQNNCQMQQQWATPFKTHTPPVEDFGKLDYMGSVNFHMHRPSVKLSLGFITGVHCNLSLYWLYISSRGSYTCIYDKLLENDSQFCTNL